MRRVEIKCLKEESESTSGVWIAYDPNSSASPDPGLCAEPGGQRHQGEENSPPTGLVPFADHLPLKPPEDSCFEHQLIFRSPHFPTLCFIAAAWSRTAYPRVGLQVSAREAGTWWREAPDCRSFLLETWEWGGGVRRRETWCSHTGTCKALGTQGGEMTAEQVATVGQRPLNLVPWVAWSCFSEVAAGVEQSRPGWSRAVPPVPGVHQASFQASVFPWS